MNIFLPKFNKNISRIVIVVAGVLTGCSSDSVGTSNQQIRQFYQTNEQQLNYITKIVRERRAKGVVFERNGEVREGEATLLDNDRVEKWKSLIGALPIRALRSLKRSDNQLDVLVILSSQGFAFGGSSKGLAHIPAYAEGNDDRSNGEIIKGQRPWQKLTKINSEWFIYVSER